MTTRHSPVRRLLAGSGVTSRASAVPDVTATPDAAGPPSWRLLVAESELSRQQPRELADPPRVLAGVVVPELGGQCQPLENLEASHFELARALLHGRFEAAIVLVQLQVQEPRGQQVANAKQGLDGIEVPTPLLEEAPPGRSLVLGVRPEHVTLSDAGAYRGRIEAAEYLGTTQIVTLSVPHGTLKARIPSGRVARVGETVGLGFNPRTLSLFDAAGGRALRTKANARVLHG